MAGAKTGSAIAKGVQRPFSWPCGAEVREACHKGEGWSNVSAFPLVFVSGDCLAKEEPTSLCSATLKKSQKSNWCSFFPARLIIFGGRAEPNCDTPLNNSIQNPTWNSLIWVIERVLDTLPSSALLESRKRRGRGLAWKRVAPSSCPSLGAATPLQWRPKKTPNLLGVFNLVSSWALNVPYRLGQQDSGSMAWSLGTAGDSKAKFFFSLSKRNKNKQRGWLISAKKAAILSRLGQGQVRVMWAGSEPGGSPGNRIRVSLKRTPCMV